MRTSDFNRALSGLMVFVFVLIDFIPFARALNKMDEDTLYTKLKFESKLNTVTPVVNSDVVLEENANDQTKKSVLQAASNLVATSAGPGQSETSGFSLNSTDGMVNKFTGDFNHSIPVMSVDGYPLVLNYNSNVGMFSEASWVGLGWDLSVGGVNREMRTVPDEFNGTDEIVRTYNQRKNEMRSLYSPSFAGYGEKLGGYLGLNYGLDGNDAIAVSFSLNISLLKGNYINTYLGKGSTFDFGLQAAMNVSQVKESADGKTSTEAGIFGGRSLSFGYSRDSKNGISRNSSLGLSAGYSPTGEGRDFGGGGLSATFGKSFHSRSGMTEKSLGLEIEGGLKRDFGKMTAGVGASYTGITTVSYGTQTSIPRVMVTANSKTFQSNYDIFLGLRYGNLTTRIGQKYQSYASESEVLLTNDQIIQPAFGFLHSAKRQDYYYPGKFPVMDFQRGTEQEYSEEMKHLPFSSQSYDLFHVNGLGIAGTFRAGRTDFGTFYDPSIKSQSNMSPYDAQNKDMESISGGMILTPPTFVTYAAGYSSGTQKGEVESGVWDLINTLKFENNDVSISEFDPTTYFKGIGEMTPNDMNAWEMLGGNLADNFDVNKDGKEITLDDYLKRTETNVSSVNLNGANVKPVTANCFIPKTAVELDGISNYAIQVYSTEGSLSGTTAFVRETAKKKEHHISSVEVVNKDGLKYNFLLPAYNLTTQNVSFASGIIDNVGVNPGAALSYNENTGLVTYTSTDNSVNNNRGRSHHYDKSNMPAYAHSYLLTSITTSDYIDRTNNGPSLDDIGNYYKFNYRSVYTESAPYKWRFPISGDYDDDPKALQQKGLLGTQLDDVAHYSYGEKEIWYSHSLETKNQIAFFYLEDRKDAYGVLNENGQLDSSMPLKCLKKIVLYNLSDFNDDPINAIPLQTVEFEYDYSLCKENPSNLNTYNPAELDESGKLTLKKIRSYSGNSKELGLLVYSFKYDEANNPNFNYLESDAWGTYKPNNTSLPNDTYPFVQQDDVVEANNNAKSWKLIEIVNPNGGEITIEYEADRYKFVQNRRAMRNFEIHKMTNIIELLALQDQTAWNGSSNSYTSFNKEGFDETYLTNLFNSFSYSTTNVGFIVDAVTASQSGLPYFVEHGLYTKHFFPNNVIIFKLAKNLSNLSREKAHTVVKDSYFKLNNSPSQYIEKLHAKVKVNIKDEVSDLVPVFMDVSKDLNNIFLNMLPFQDDVKSIGVMPPNAQGVYEYGYVIVDPVNSGSIEVTDKKDTEQGEDNYGFSIHPIQKMALDFARYNLPDKVYGSCVNCETSGGLAIDKKAFYGKDIYKFMIKDADYTPSFDATQSFIRLCPPDSIKYGGNARVASITYSDNWNDISGEYDSDYTWKYSYSERNNEKGVAAYEPAAINEENPFYYWDTYIDVNKKFPDDSKFHVTPLTAQLYPNPVVGYEEIKVSFSGGVTQGHSLTNYYTARQFPTRSEVTQLEKSKSQSRLSLIKAFLGDSYSLWGFTEGYFVETNDFHGKIKSSSLYNRKNILQAKTTYQYAGLRDQIPMIDREGSITNRNVALEYDIHVDSRLVEDESKYFMWGINVGVTFAIPSPIPTLVSVAPAFVSQDRKEAFYSNCLIKHINRSAILKGVQTEYLGSINYAEDLLYDRFSGNVVASSLTDEFNDKLYSVNYPSHWFYPNLCELCPNTTISPIGTFSGNDFVIQTPLNTDLNDYFSKGDIVKITNGATSYKVYILSLDETNSSLIFEDGTPVELVGGTWTMILLRSNRDNRLNEVMQSIVTKKAISTSVGPFAFPKTDIINSSVLTYRDKLNVRCGRPGTKESPSNEVEIQTNINPFLFGVVGDLVPENQFSWQDERVQDAHDHGIRFDGTYHTSQPTIDDFSPFYGLNGTSKNWYTLPDIGHPNHIVGNDYQLWREMGKVKLFDEYGKPLEGVDQIDVSSSVLYGYNSNLSLVPIAQAVNAKKQQIAFDGFEDYSYHASSGSPSIMESHFDFRSSLSTNVSLVNDVRHSGLHSLRINSGASASTTKNIGNSCSQITSGLAVDSFYVDRCICIPGFEPSFGEYVIGGWIKQTGTAGKIRVTLSNSSSSTYFDFLPEDNKIDGWQRIEGVFEIPSGYDNIQVSLINGNASSMFVDDIRIHPFLSGMSTVVYDPQTLLPMASHDGYNYTTFYNYDENLNQVRVRVETENGIQTIVESEFGGYKVPKTN